MISGEAVYFDGASAQRRTVRVELQEDGIAIRGDDGDEAHSGAIPISRTPTRRPAWCASARRARRSSRGWTSATRRLVAELMRRRPDLRHRRHADYLGTGRIVFWSIAAVVSLVLTVVYLVPLVADRLAPFIPIPVERRLGEAVDSQVRALFGAETCDAEPGRAALAKLSGALTAPPTCPCRSTSPCSPPKRRTPSRCPAATSTCFGALLEKAEARTSSPACWRTSSAMSPAATACESSCRPAAARSCSGCCSATSPAAPRSSSPRRCCVDSAYSRQAETNADAFAAALMQELGRSPKPLGTFLLRLDSERQRQASPSC